MSAASTRPRDPAEVGQPRLSETVPPGGAWSHVLKLGTALRLTALDDGANVSTLLFNQDLIPERLNLPDTLKSQERACVTPPMVLIGEVGNALCTVTGSSLDWHDALCGHIRDAQVRERWGPSSYATDRNAWRRSAREGLLREMAKRDLDRRNLHQCVNFFSRAQPAGDARGRLTFVEDHASAGDWVELRAEVNLLVVLSTAPHPLDERLTWSPSGIQVEIRDVGVAGDDDPARSFRDQSARALDQTRRLHA